VVGIPPAYDVQGIVDVLAKCRPFGVLPRTVRENETPPMDIDHLLVNMLGFAATAFSVLMWIPQARTTWQNRNDAIRLAGISETTQWFTMIGALLWGVFGVLSHSFWVAAPTLVSLPLALATIVVVRRGRALPLTRSVPIISTSEPLSVLEGTGSISIVSTEGAAAVGEIGMSHASASTGTIPILSTEACVPVDEAREPNAFTMTAAVSVLA
jgi:uncharacterized protein with PQ loop repeat